MMTMTRTRTRTRTRDLEMSESTYSESVLGTPARPFLILSQLLRSLFRTL